MEREYRSLCKSRLQGKINNHREYARKSTAIGLGNDIYPCKLQGTQNEWFGKRGASWHVAVAIIKDKVNYLEE